MYQPDDSFSQSIPADATYRVLYGCPAPADPPPIAMEVEIPEGLHDQVQAFLVNSPEWDINRLAVSALALFLLQKAPPEMRNRALSQTYLATLFPPQ